MKPNKANFPLRRPRPACRRFCRRRAPRVQPAPPRSHADDLPFLEVPRHLLLQPGSPPFGCACRRAGRGCTARPARTRRPGHGGACCAGRPPASRRPRSPSTRRCHEGSTCCTKEEFSM
ncbi:hypothetical protein SETIT_3G094100v2 [Setaria italica]|uniref:Uncharacterized protein n=1 Tax=Setaria italica TaxID=4555 RepID=A0A368QD22_SETIT|nr:hypothetical protein SETIT_3G094100v2 [Setaria italica]